MRIAFKNSRIVFPLNNVKQRSTEWSKGYRILNNINRTNQT